MEKENVSEKSPFAGCAILIAALLVMVFLIGFSVSVLFRQSAAIAEFTDEKPSLIPLEVLEDRESELNRLAEKLEAFRLAVDSEESAEMSLTAEEINLAIAAYEPFKDFRGTLRVSSVSPQEIRLKISFPLNGRPRLAKENEGGWIASDPRFLNGTMVAEPGLLNREIVLQIREIEVPWKKVAPEFIAQMSPYRVAERYVGGEGMGAVMAKLTAVELGEGTIRFIKTTGVVPSDTITREQVDSASQKIFIFFAVAASLFLLFVAFVIFMGLRLKKRRDAAVSGG